MLSRVASSIYWMNRYVERAENTARFVEVTFTFLLDLPGASTEQWKPLLMTTADLPLYEELYGEVEKTNVINFLTFDRRNPNSIVRCLEFARENARSIREVISSEMWEQINTFHLFTSSKPLGVVLREPHAFYRKVRQESHEFEGTTDATMTHGEGWHFGQVGRHIERADKTSRILDVKYFILLPTLSDVGSTFDNLQWAALLRSASALQAYRRKHGQPNPQEVAEFLLLDREFPRSLHYCVSKAESSLRAITGSATHTFSNHPEQLLGRLRSRLDYTSISEIFDQGFHEFLDQIQADLNEIDENIYSTFFDATPSTRQPVPSES